MFTDDGVVAHCLPLPPSASFFLFIFFTVIHDFTLYLQHNATILFFVPFCPLLPVNLPYQAPSRNQELLNLILLFVIWHCNTMHQLPSITWWVKGEFKCQVGKSKE
ncbi:hypothetical protein L2E82_33391 [Cichorium intybus]|uniref:Uncharacterized protein n=1 Tax=Cichorium intybus TaxID=13427 RepID=A0ACB9BK08_CICIN|nr:hypothetical protein L2E82_33391 [Cichorium intybus]